MGTDLAVAHDTTPFLTVYPFNRGVGFGVKYADPSVLPTGNAGSVVFHPNGFDIFFSHATTPFLDAYRWLTGTGFGSRYTDWSPALANTVRGMAFSKTEAVPELIMPLLFG